MREQGSLKGQGTHRGNLCVHIFKQILTLKDIQRKKSKQEIYSFFLLSENTSGGPKVIQVKAARNRRCLSRDHISMCHIDGCEQEEEEENEEEKEG